MPPTATIFIFISSLLHISALDIRQCNRALGMTNHQIRDDQITASSSHDELSTGPQHARLRLHTGGGAWCPNGQINSHSKHWIQVSFTSEMVISAVETEGRYDDGRGNEYANAYRIQYWRSSLQQWVPYKGDGGVEVLRGNTDTHSGVIRVLDGAIVARRLRIIPVSNTTRTVCLRFEVYGCPYRDVLSSYSAPIGSSADALSLIDTSYDGTAEDGVMIGGLGKLWDGVVGDDNFESFPQKWLGWRKQRGVDHITLRFAFTEKQNISSVLLHAANQYKQHAPSFSTAVLSFSLDGVHFSPREVDFHYVSDRKFQSARWIRIPVPDRIAQVLEMKLFFDESASWLLLSEAKFETNRVVFDVGMETQDDITFHQISEDNPTSGYGSAGLLVVLLLITVSLVACISALFQRKRVRVKASSPSPSFTRGKDVKIAMHGGIIKHVTQSTYQMACDNVHNALLERSPLPEVASDYAEPDISCDGSTLPMIASVYNQSMEGSHYAATDIISSNSLRKSPLSSIVKYSDYGEVYCTTLPEINRNKLLFVNKIGQGEFGEVHLCQLENRLVAVKRLHSTSQEDEMAFQREIRVLGTLKHSNVVEVIGVSTIDKPMICIMEYMENGDLKTYFSKLDNINTPLCISLCTQLAAGLAYLESCNFVHRDIAARNCLIDSEGNAKIADFGMARSLYSAEYYRVEGRFVLPIRWMAPETLLLGKFSSASDVWAFGVTMWEIFSRCQSKPFCHLSDEAVVNNIQHTQLDGQLEHILSRPALCPPIIYSQLMLPSWNADPDLRPRMETIHLNLQSMIHQQRI